jgi:hypothetical protein
MPYLTGGLAVGNIETTTPFTTGVNITPRLDCALALP